MEKNNLTHGDIYYDKKESIAGYKVVPSEVAIDTLVSEFLSALQNNHMRAYDIYFILKSYYKNYEPWYALAQKMQYGYFFEKVLIDIVTPNNTSIESLLFVIRHTQSAWLKHQAIIKVAKIKQNTVILENKKDNKKSLPSI